MYYTSNHNDWAVALVFYHILKPVVCSLEKLQGHLTPPWLYGFGYLVLIILHYGFQVQAGQVHLPGIVGILIGQRAYLKK